MKSECIFCRIANGEIRAEILHETEQVVVFKDINPIAPVHYLVIPKTHLATLDDATEADRQVLGELLLAAAEAARKLGVEKAGYRLVLNTRADAGQEIFHVHMHILAGRKFRWPPG